MDNTEQQKGKFAKWAKTSITARMLTVGFLTLILLIPLEFIFSLIRERKYRQEDVLTEISDKWGGEVLLYGPILKVPYKTYKETRFYNERTKSHSTESEEIMNNAYFFPNTLDISSNIDPEEKKRGIYTTAVYKSNINISGSFASPDFSELDIKDKDIIWSKAKLLMFTSNLKGVTKLVEANVNANNYLFASNNENSNINLHQLESKFLKEEDLPIGKDMKFNLDMSINGSTQISFIPIGKETNANIKSNWQTANFLGEYLPYNSDKITKDGFDAKWKVLDINRPFAQQNFNQIPRLQSSAFGVNFKIPVDEYQKSERSVKYGILVIALTFLVFFLIQTMSKISIHPFQYLMIGIALTMFYTLLISISEHSSFFKAYLIAGAAVVTLITLYSKSILKGAKFPLFIGISLTALYTFIFVIIQLESYALLVGSVGLFTILALVMFASRKIDWQNG